MGQRIETNHVEAYLELYGFEEVTHEEISAQLGMEPTKIYVKGQPVNPPVSRRAPYNRWLYQTYTSEGPWLNIGEQLDELLALVSARWEAFEALAGHSKVVVKCAVFIYVKNNQSTPAVYLERRHVAMLERLQAEFDVDLYAQ